MTKIIIKTHDEYGGYIDGSFEFNDETWIAIGGNGTGSIGHYSSQGSRTLYASPRKSPKLGRHRYVLYGTGYYPTIKGGGLGNGGLSWGTAAREVDEQTALECMDPEHLATYSDAPEKLDV